MLQLHFQKTSDVIHNHEVSINIVHVYLQGKFAIVIKQKIPEIRLPFQDFQST